MDLQSLKLDLISRIMAIDKPAVLIEINNILAKETKSDWWDMLPEEVQESILEGLADVQEGNVFAHENIMLEAKQKYGL